jgi:hypothetical protein
MTKAPISGCDISLIDFIEVFLRVVVCGGSSGVPPEDLWDKRKELSVRELLVLLEKGNEG